MCLCARSDRSDGRASDKTFSDEISGGIQWWDQYTYVAIGGVMGSLGTLFASCSSRLIVLSLEPPPADAEGHTGNQFDTGWPYLFIALMILFIVLQTHYLNQGMGLGDTMSTVPVFQVCHT